LKTIVIHDDHYPNHRPVLLDDEDVVIVPRSLTYGLDHEIVLPSWQDPHGSVGRFELAKSSAST
jgi:hypothetical protein